MNKEILISTAVGAFIGSSITLIATIISHHLQVSERKKTEESVIHGFLQGIHDEIETLWDLYLKGIGNKLESLEEGKGLECYYPVTQEYFTFYMANAYLVGKVKDHDLRKNIVSVYAKAKGLLDSYRMNNEVLNKLEHSALVYQSSKISTDRSNMLAYQQSLITYASSLREYHNDLKVLIQNLLRALRKQGVLNKNV
ncbi:MAG: hypothetical protein ABIA97_00740 [Candidatus Omnitrophota bacterium]